VLSFGSNTGVTIMDPMIPVVDYPSCEMYLHPDLNGFIWWEPTIRMISPTLQSMEHVENEILQ